MKLELITTGDEVLRGAIVDSNAAFFLALVHEIGWLVTRHVTVADDQQAIAEALLAAAARADVVVVSGGLGPTADDVTAAAAATASGQPLELHTKLARQLEARWRSRRSEEMPPNNLRQVTIPRGAEVLENPEGSCAPFLFRLGKAQAFFLPGVPREFRQIAKAEVLPRLVAMSGAGAMATKTLHCFGITESGLDHAIGDLMQRWPDVRWGFRTRFPENMLTMTVRGSDAGSSAEQLARAETEVRARLGSVVFGEGEATIASVAGEALRQRGETVALAESCTGGLTASMLTERAGASDYFLMSAVVYANAAKQTALGVPEDLLQRCGAVSEEVARAMANGVRDVARSTWGLSLTGIAGPDGGSSEKPVGTVFVGLAGPAVTIVSKYQLRGDRGQIRLSAAWEAIDLLRRTLLQVS